eukprot:8031951-Lingulodinium_polyedra.AAC.1
MAPVTAEEIKVRAAARNSPGHQDHCQAEDAADHRRSDEQLEEASTPARGEAATAATKTTQKRPDTLTPKSQTMQEPPP